MINYHVFSQEGVWPPLINYVYLPLKWTLILFEHMMPLTFYTPVTISLSNGIEKLGFSFGVLMCTHSSTNSQSECIFKKSEPAGQLSVQTVSGTLQAIDSPKDQRIDASYRKHPMKKIYLNDFGLFQHLNMKVLVPVHKVFTEMLNKKVVTFMWGKKH